MHVLLWLGLIVCLCILVGAAFPIGWKLAKTTQKGQENTLQQYSPALHGGPQSAQICSLCHLIVHRYGTKEGQIVCANCAAGGK